ncbi:MAG: type I-C CRISPR-associated endonuclease Cas1c [Thermodesulfobacteriota bacterium]
MKKHLNTLFVTTQGSYLAKDGECVLIRVEREDKARIPIHTLGGVVCFGQVSLSPQLMAHCAEHGVGVSFLSENGRFLARVHGPVSGNVLLRREQYRWADDPARSAAVARFVLTGKLANSRRVVLRAARDHGGDGRGERLRYTAARLADCLERLQDERLALDELRGIEGEAGNLYFGAFDHLVTSGEEAFRFAGRNRRPPLDPVNCLLSFVYTLLVHDVRSALECVGLDPAVGYLHRDRPGRPSLALDLMEEFRPVFADRLVLSLVNLGQVKPRGFRKLESGAVLLEDEARKEVIVAYQKRKQEVVEHPFLKEKMPVGLLWHTQALLLARHLRGDLDGYPPYIPR